MTMRVPAEDEDLVEFHCNLRHAINEALTGIVHGFCDTPKGAAILTPSVEDIATFFRTTAEDIHKLDDEERDDDRTARLIRGMTGLMGDLVDKLGPQPVLPFMNMSMDWVTAVLRWSELLECFELERGLKDANSLVTPYAKKLLSPKPT